MALSQIERIRLDKVAVDEGFGLKRDELRYALDPDDAKGADYPSETFRVLRNKEEARFGECRTTRLVLAAWDAQEQALQGAGTAI